MRRTSYVIQDYKSKPTRFSKKRDIVKVLNKMLTINLTLKHVGIGVIIIIFGNVFHCRNGQ